MKKLLISWNISRIIRLTLGVVIIVQGIATGEALLILAGSFIAATALLNIGCCGTSGCNIPEANLNKNQKKIIYEELDKEK